MDIHEIGEFLERIAELSESVYWLSSPDLSKIIYISPAYEKIWGRSREELYTNPEKWITYLHPDDVKNHHPIHELAERIKLEKSAARYDESYRIVRPNGEIRYILDRGFPIYIDDVCQGVTGFATDITERKLAEDELKKVAYQLEGAKLISGSIAHEIRTPLATIKSTIWTIEHALDTRDVEEIKRGLHIINKKVDQSNRIINMLLIKLQSLEFGKSEFSICSAKDCVQEALNEFTIPSDLVNKVHFDTANNFEFLGNKVLITHVLMNLLKNATFYLLKAKKGEIYIWLEKHPEGNQIHFKDTGTGVKKEILPHIFDSFFTTESSTGTGVGLAFSKMVMQSHHGQIECISEEGEYAEFILSFPILDKVKN